MNPLFSDFTFGFLSVSRGFGLLLINPRIRRWAIIPFILAALVLVVGFYFGFSVLGGQLPHMVSSGLAFAGIEAGSLFYSLLYWLILILTWPLGLFLVFYFLFLLVRIVAAPFYSLLAEAALVEIGLLQESEFHLKNWLRVSLLMLKASLLKLLFFGPLAALLFLLSFIPGLGLVTGFCFLLMVAFDVLDASFEALQWSFRERMRYFNKHLSAFSGMAFAMGLVFLIPGLNFFLLPVAVVGGADLLRRIGPISVR
jgi:CysZ protein